MYATAEEYLGYGKRPPKSHLLHEQYMQHDTQTRENFTPQIDVDVNIGKSQDVLDMVWKGEHIHNTADPKVWGPAFWFSLHSSAVHYPVHASPIVKERMKGRILAIPYEIPCGGCRPHASAFVEQHRDNLNHIVSGRHALGKFYVDFHNKVNLRYNKPIWTYDQAYKYYSKGANISYLQYK